MFFPTLVLITVECEHHGLEQSIDFCKADKAAKSSNMSGLRLQQEEEIGILLQFSVIRVVPFCGIHLFQRPLDFTLLIYLFRIDQNRQRQITYLIQCHAVLN